MNWVLLQAFDSEGEVRVVESKLNSEGIETWVEGSHSRVLGPVPDMLRLMVQPQDLEKAKSILQV
jgi:hypothetical protein